MQASYLEPGFSKKYSCVFLEKQTGDQKNVWSQTKLKTLTIFQTLFIIGRLKERVFEKITQLEKFSMKCTMILSIKMLLQSINHCIASNVRQNRNWFLPAQRIKKVKSNFKHKLSYQRSKTWNHETVSKIFYFYMDYGNSIDTGNI